MPRKAIHPLNTLGTVTEWASENWANSRRATWITLNGHRPTLIMHQSTSTSSSLTIIVRLLVKICCKRQEGKGMQGWSLLVPFMKHLFIKSMFINVIFCGVPVSVSHLWLYTNVVCLRLWVSSIGLGFIQWAQGLKKMVSLKWNGYGKVITNENNWSLKKSMSPENTNFMQFQ